MGNWAQLYADLTAQLQAGQALGFWDNAFVGFYQSFVAAGRWRLYLNGLLTTLEATILALLLGVVLGVVVAVIRTARHRRLGVGKKAAAVLDGGEKLLAALLQKVALPDRRDKVPESLQLLLRKPDPGADFLECRICGGIQFNRRIKIGLLLHQVLLQRGDFSLALLSAGRFGIDGGNQSFEVGRKDILRQNRGVERIFQIAPRGFEI